jgi:hypothetical protein
MIHGRTEEERHHGADKYSRTREARRRGHEGRQAVCSDISREDSSRRRHAVITAIGAGGGDQTSETSGLVRGSYGCVGIIVCGKKKN